MGTLDQKEYYCTVTCVQSRFCTVLEQLFMLLLLLLLQSLLYQAETSNDSGVGAEECETKARTDFDKDSDKDAVSRTTTTTIISSRWQDSPREDRLASLGKSQQLHNNFL